jgi:tetratricopeptide (TPR) repeat protein
MYYFTLLLFILVTISGCAQVEKKSISPIQKKQIHIKKLNKEVKKLDSHDKRLIYKSIKNEIEHYKNKGDADYNNGYYYDALKAYKLVNFYENSPVIPQKRLNKINKIAKIRAISHYKKAKKYIAAGKKKKALIELNSVMMNNPDYKDSKSLYNDIKSKRDMKIYLNNLQNNLEMQLVNNKGSFKELQSIQKGLKNLEQYDYKNIALVGARSLLKEQKDSLLQNAIHLYKKQKLKKAKRKFYEILSLYPNDTTSEQYIKKINFRQSKQHNLYLAQEALKQNNFKDAIAYAKKVLQLEKNNKKALNIIKKVKLKEAKKVRFYVKAGKNAYNKKELDRAKEYFEKALDINKTDNTALIYYKKIQRQLQTIKSLQ